MGAKFEVLQQKHDKLFKVADFFQTPFLLFIRVFWGGVFFQKGFEKFSNFPSTVGFLDGLGIPVPTVSAFLLASTEYLGGLCLIFGLASRIVSLPLCFAALVAYQTVYRGEFFSLTFYEAPPFSFLMVPAIVLLFGPGKISLDYLVGWFLSSSGGGEGAGGGGGE